MTGRDADRAGLTVRGPATAEEVAAIVTALRVCGGSAAASRQATRFERWRRERIAALRDNR